MGLPAKRRTPRSKRERNAHIKVKKLTLSVCEKCQSPIRPHHACATCGTYRGKTVVNTEKRTARAKRNAHSHAHE